MFHVLKVGDSKFKWWVNGCIWNGPLNDKIPDKCMKETIIRRNETTVFIEITGSHWKPRQFWRKIKRDENGNEYYKE